MTNESETTKKNGFVEGVTQGISNLIQAACFGWFLGYASDKFKHPLPTEGLIAVMFVVLALIDEVKS